MDMPQLLSYAFGNIEKTDKKIKYSFYTLVENYSSTKRINLGHL